jgi:HPt (histidine-containing phosphotransfer) domain-containing protein
LSDTVLLFDLAQIDEAWGGTADETYRMVLGIFAPEAEGLRAGLADALARHDLTSLERLAHTLRGAAANVAASRLAASAGALERAAARGDLAALPGLFGAIEVAVAATCASIAGGGPAEGG